MNSGDVLKDMLAQLTHGYRLGEERYAKILLTEKQTEILKRFLLRCLDTDYGDPGEAIENLILTD